MGPRIKLVTFSFVSLFELSSAFHGFRIVSSFVIQRKAIKANHTYIMCLSRAAVEIERHCRRRVERYYISRES